MHLTYWQALDEPIEVIERAFQIWEFDAERVKSEEKKQRNN